MVKCPQCNAENMDGSLFCDECGASLTEAAAAPPAPAAEASPAPPVAPSAPTPAVEAAAPPEGQITCPSCQHVNTAGSQFCENCGGQLAGAPAAVAPAAEAAPTPAPVAAPAFAARLIVVGTNAELPLDFSGKTEILVGRTDPVSNVFPEVDLTPHGGFEGGVSRRHAKITLQGDQCLIEDLNSTNGTKVNNAFIRPGQPQALKDGDTIELGQVKLMFKTG